MASLKLQIKLQAARVYGILDTTYLTFDAMTKVVEQLLQGGIDLLQLRAKHSTKEEIIAMGRAILPFTRAAGIPLLLNDYPDLVKIVGAQGAHVGQEDMSLQEARALVGEEAILGLSTHSLEQVQQSIAQQPDYIGFGPLFPTPTKPDAPSIGLTNIAAAQSMVDFPLFCIGGINLRTLPQVIDAGAHLVVMVSALLNDENRVELIPKIKKLLPQ